MGGSIQVLFHDSDEELGTLDSTTLAVERTSLALERTLMAWVRTATSLISFGFSIYKFFHLAESGSAPRRGSLLGPREFGMMMIGIALVMLVVASIQHWRSLKTLRRVHAEVPRSLTLVLAVFIAVLGSVAFLSAVFRQ